MCMLMDNDEFFESMAETIGISVEDLLAAAQLNASRGVRLFMGPNESYEDIDQPRWEEFWERWRQHTGNTGEDDQSGDGRFFTCSC